MPPVLKFRNPQTGEFEILPTGVGPEGPPGPPGEAAYIVINEGDPVPPGTPEGTLVLVIPA